MREFNIRKRDARETRVRSKNRFDMNLLKWWYRREELKVKKWWEEANDIWICEEKRSRKRERENEWRKNASRLMRMF